MFYMGIIGIFSPCIASFDFFIEFWPEKIQVNEGIFVLITT